MKTLDNGVVVFERMTEWENTTISSGAVAVVRGDDWYIARPKDAYGRTLNIRCYSEQDALDIAGFFAKRGNSAWISVKDRLPDDGENILVWNHLGVIALAWLNDDGKWEQPSGDCYSFPCVTHWMPLPEPPKSNTDVKP